MFTFYLNQEGFLGEGGLGCIYLSDCLSVSMIVSDLSGIILCGLGLTKAISDYIVEKL